LRDVEIPATALDRRRGSKYPLEVPFNSRLCA
jgi:hypothetical protein